MTSLHVKYRPITFDEVIGQDGTVASLKQAIKGKRARSYIFTGPSGTGKTTLARILANEFAGGQATIANVEEIDAATNSGADAMRDIVNRSLYRAIGGNPSKSIILDEAHRLSAAAWTILLKPIEEPPKHVYWFLLSTEPGKIPKPIQTRCLHFVLKLLSEDDILETLIRVIDKEGFDIPDEVITTIAENSGGSPRQALVNLEACLFCRTSSEAHQFLRSGGQTKEIVDLARALVARRPLPWQSVIGIIKAMENVEPESIRIVLVNYISVVLLNSKTELEAKHLLGILECFSKSYNPSDKMAPLLLSIGLAMGLDR